LSRDLQTTLLKQEKKFIERVKHTFSVFKAIADDHPSAGDSIHSAMIRCVEMLQESGEYIETPNPKNKKRRRTAYLMTHYLSTGRILKALIRTMIEQTTLKQVSNPFDTKIGFK
jgi:hypothetical protein